MMRMIRRVKSRGLIVICRYLELGTTIYIGGVIKGVRAALNLWW